MYNYSEESKKIMEYVLKESDIYHITELPVSFAALDADCQKNDPGFLSFQWLYDKLGFFHGIFAYNSFIKRVLEFQQYGDYLKSLRQRFNITHEMINCNLNSNLPVHISVSQKKDSPEEIELDLNSTLDSEFAVIIHPGQTRAQGSVFLRDPLKNVILYINKEHKIKLKKYSFIKKIETIEDLLPIYRADNTLSNNKTATIDFYMPGRGDIKEINKGLKKHIQNDTHILKANGIYSEDDKNEKISLHSSTLYLPKTFTTMNSFSRIFFNNDINLYTDNKEEAKGIIEQGRKEILSRVLKEEYGKKYFLSATRTSSVKLKDVELNGGSTWGRWASLGKRNHDFIHNSLTKEESLISEVADVLIRLDSKPKQKFSGFTLRSTYETNINDFKGIVKLNDYRGFCITLDTTKLKKGIYRDIYELFFCIPSTFSIAKTKNDSISIINCEHEYWKTKQNYKEYIINNKFFQKWQQ
jgi:hypothetical protein